MQVWGDEFKYLASSSSAPAQADDALIKIEFDAIQKVKNTYFCYFTLFLPCFVCLIIFSFIELS